MAFNVKFLLYTITDYVFILLKMRPSAIDFPQGSWGHLVCDFLSVFERAKLLLLLLDQIIGTYWREAKGNKLVTFGKCAIFLFT